MKTRKELWKNKLQIVSHIYWEEKKEFELDIDSYFTWTAFALESGSFKYQIGNEQDVARKNQVIFCPPYLPLYRKSLTSMSLHFLAFNFDYPINETDRKKYIPVLKASPTDKIRLYSNFSYLRMLNLASDERSIFRKEWILNDLWLLVCNEWDSIPRQEDLAGFSQTEDKLMNSVMDWLINNADTQFNVQMLSDAVNLSPVQFTRRFQKAYNTSPSKVIRTIRIKKAAKLLLSSNMTLEEIAEQCGYDNGFYLSRVFKQTMGTSPSEFQEKNKV